ncbi:hypothetical protein E4U13_005406, partial [Claviceps humidiphila]
MARTISCLATLLAARNAFVQAKPVPDERPLPTLDVRPIKVVTELEVSLSTSFPAPTNLVFCHGETLSISQAGFLSTPLIKWYHPAPVIARHLPPVSWQDLWDLWDLWDLLDLPDLPARQSMLEAQALEPELVVLVLEVLVLVPVLEVLEVLVLVPVALVPVALVPVALVPVALVP